MGRTLNLSEGDAPAAIAARDGDYAIYNLAAGAYTVTAYAVGHVYTAAEATVAASDVAVDLTLTDAAAGSVSGQVSIVNGGGASSTSVVAFIESTFDATTGRGVAPPGLRSPRAGEPDVSGAFVIEGVPPGATSSSPRSRTTALSGIRTIASPAPRTSTSRSSRASRPSRRRRSRSPARSR